ncbi:MAG: hypothetical protein IPM30_01475 [Burkholderiales bacterium]|nr:hypothetical protein [Burkholderiales bacterium]
MKPSPASEDERRERLWRNAFYGFSALMAAFALVDLDAGRLAGAMGNAGVCCLMLSLINQFPAVKQIVGTAAKRRPSEESRREGAKPSSDGPWTDRLAGVGWTLLLASLILRAFGAD